MGSWDIEPTMEDIKFNTRGWIIFSIITGVFICGASVGYNQVDPVLVIFLGIIGLGGLADVITCFYRKDFNHKEDIND